VAEDAGEFRRKALLVIEDLASKKKPDVEWIWRIAHVGLGCENPHMEWRAYLEWYYKKLVAERRIV
jgi:hypothetical protein